MEDICSGCCFEWAKRHLGACDRKDMEECEKSKKLSDKEKIKEAKKIMKQVQGMIKKLK